MIRLPTADDIGADVQRMVDLGPRLTGYEGHDRFCGWIEVAKPALIESGLQRHALLKPPLQITPGRAFHWLGVPHVSGIAGPTYLLKVTRGGEMDKFDAELAARQIGFYADVVRRLDTADLAALRNGDPTLGQDGGSEEDRTYQDESTQG